VLAIGLDAVLADRRADASGLEPDGIMRIEICELKLCAGVLVEQIKRTPGLCVSIHYRRIR